MIYAIGDIHGKRTMLQAVLDHLYANAKPEDTVVFLGDYIDRGEDSRGVIEALLRWRDTGPETVFLRGNHEQMMLDAYTDGAAGLWLNNGGVQTLKSYGTFYSPYSDAWRNFVPKSHLDFMTSAQLEYKAGGYHFVHAGLVPPGQSWGFQSSVMDCPEPRLWIREPFLSSDADFGAVVVFGHTPQRSYKPLVMANKVGLDTAATFGGRLSLAGFDGRTNASGFPVFSLFQVSAEDDEQGRLNND